MVHVKIKRLNGNTNPLPEHKTLMSAGADISAWIDKPVIIPPGEFKIITTGFALALPSGFECQGRPRSGMACKHGVTIINAPGTIDADYRGEIMVGLVNHSKKPFVVNCGDRIAQLLVKKYERIEFEEVKELDKTERGTNGHGSTGRK
ncbi:dUTP diphosphatase [Candidatus Pacearchaeota archaeon]|nr:dUTP diphosphatase [Candidatus Pacearchaeota archaeon]